MRTRIIEIDGLSYTLPVNLYRKRKTKSNGLIEGWAVFFASTNEFESISKFFNDEKCGGTQEAYRLAIAYLEEAKLVKLGLSSRQTFIDRSDSYDRAMLNRVGVSPYYGWRPTSPDHKTYYCSYQSQLCVHDGDILTYTHGVGTEDTINESRFRQGHDLAIAAWTWATQYILQYGRSNLIRTKIPDDDDLIFFLPDDYDPQYPSMDEVYEKLDRIKSMHRKQGRIKTWQSTKASNRIALV